MAWSSAKGACVAAALGAAKHGCKGGLQGDLTGRASGEGVAEKATERLAEAAALILLCVGYRGPGCRRCAIYTAPSHVRHTGRRVLGRVQRRRLRALPSAIHDVAVGLLDHSARQRDGLHAGVMIGSGMGSVLDITH